MEVKSIKGESNIFKIKNLIINYILYLDIILLIKC